MHPLAISVDVLISEVDRFKYHLERYRTRRHFCLSKYWHQHHRAHSLNVWRLQTIKTSNEMLKATEFKKQTMDFFPRQILLFFSPDSSVVVCCYAMRVGRKETTRLRTCRGFFSSSTRQQKKRTHWDFPSFLHRLCICITEKEHTTDWRVEKKERKRAE